MMLTAAQLAKDAGIADGGYRVQMNCNADGGQVVYHIHLHLMGGRAFGT
jgi:histidine triad (HIT) family protein